MTLEEELLPQPVQRWLGIGELAEMSEEATVDWVPPQAFIDTLSWQLTGLLETPYMSRER